MTIGNKIAGGFGLTLAILIVIGSLSYWNTTKIIDSNHRVTHTHKVLETLGTILSLLKDAETGQRGYLITGKDNYLQPYREALQGIDPALATLAELTSDNTRQEKRIQDLRALITAKLNELKKTI